jgi:endoglucanase
MKTKILLKPAMTLLATIILSLLFCRVYGVNSKTFNSYTITEFIKIDQFGYRPNDQKIAVISNPQTGYNSALSFTPGTTYQVRNWNTDTVVFTGSITAWNSGAEQAQSGDKVWWFDFSSVTTSGVYYIFDPANNVGSYKFVIDPCVYNAALKQALRMFYYQRCGSAKTSACAGKGWADTECHTGILQDTDCRLYNDNSVSTSRNLKGGWHDAGDYNKYVNFTFSTVMDLLLAYKIGRAHV